MSSAVARFLSDGKRLHLQHGPIDLVIGIDDVDARAGYVAAANRFQTVLEELVAELPLLKSQVSKTRPDGPVAQRMYDAVIQHTDQGFVTPMAAVAGSVADEILDCILAALPVKRCYVNNGGDIAVHVDGNASYTAAMLGLDGRSRGKISITGNDGIGGIATSGNGGRSLSFGIAEEVTVLAKCASEADVAATLIANAVDIAGHPSIKRLPAREVDPDSDLGDRPVVIGCGSLPPSDVAHALDNGVRVAQQMCDHGKIQAAALFLQGRTWIASAQSNSKTMEIQVLEHA